jgi:hypothetical protein
VRRPGLRETVLGGAGLREAESEIIPRIQKDKYSVNYNSKETSDISGAKHCIIRRRRGL